MKAPFFELADQTIPSLFLSIVEECRERTAFHHLDGTWKTVTYGELYSLAASFALKLKDCGVQKGDRVAIVSENSPRWCAAYIAVLMRTGIAVPIDAQLGKTEIGNMLADSGTVLAFHSSGTKASVIEASSGLKIQNINLDDERIVFEESFSIIEASPDDIASIIYTSGTTGNPKGVMLTHRNFTSDAAAIIRVKLVKHDDNVLSLLPYHHTYPFMCTFLVPLFLGATVTFAPGLKAAELVSAIRDKGATIVVSVPRLLEKIRQGIVSKMKEKKSLAPLLFGTMNLCGRIRRKTGLNPGRLLFRFIHKNFGVLKFFASGGARLEPAVMNDMEALGFTILEGYGLTETSPVITYNPLNRSKAGSVGLALSGVELRMAGDGEILIRGDMVMAGYYKNEFATKEVVRGGWFYTGDIGFFDKEEYLFITGRKKEVIILSSGKNIYPEDVERIYLATPLIREICVMGMQSGVTVDSIHGVIVPDLDYAKKEMIGNISETIRWEIEIASMKLPEYMRIKGFTISTEPLPRTPLGKLRRHMVAEFMRSREEAMREREPDSLLAEDMTGRRVVAAILSLMDEDIPIRSADNLELDLGFDSLKKIGLMSSLERSFSLRLPETFTAEARTVGDLVKGLKELISGETSGDSAPPTWKVILEGTPDPEATGLINYVQSPAEQALVYILFMLMKAFFRLMFRIRGRGMDNIPLNGPFVISPNHSSYLDAFVVAAVLPYDIFRKFYFLGMKKFFLGATSAWLAKLAHVIPIDQETYLNRSLRMSAHVLNQGKALCIFPEGGRSPDGKLLEFKKGLGILAVELNIPVVPVYISGAFEAMPRGAWFIRPVKVEILFGPPMRASGVDSSAFPDRYQAFAGELKKQVEALSLRD